MQIHNLEVLSFLGFKKRQKNISLRCIRNNLCKIGLHVKNYFCLKS
ncbi:hypothetical protein AAJ76_64000137, partial [Vairimorpha ceranae]